MTRPDHETGHVYEPKAPTLREAARMLLNAYRATHVTEEHRPYWDHLRDALRWDDEREEIIRELVGALREAGSAVAGVSEGLGSAYAGTCAALAPIALKANAALSRARAAGIVG